MEVVCATVALEIFPLHDDFFIIISNFNPLNFKISLYIYI